MSPCVSHDDRNVVAGVADETVDQKAIADRFRDLALDGCHHAGRRLRVPPNRAYVSLDDRKGESHEHLPVQAQRLASTLAAPGDGAAHSREKTSDVEIGSTRTPVRCKNR
jgi:hypothetical protein